MSLEPRPATLPSISVVIAVRNGAATLQRALDSVLEQTHHCVDLVVMDGASTDGTPEILERSASRIAYWESEPDRGIFHAWNKALDHVTGDWICFIGADDRLHSRDSLATVAEALADDRGEHKVAYGYIDKHSPDGVVRRSKGAAWDRGRRRRFRRGEMIPHPATFHHRSLFESNGRFDESFRIAGDYEFLLRELLDADPLFIPVVVVDFAGGGLSDRPSNQRLVMREVYRARYMHGIAKRPAWRSAPLISQQLESWIGQHFGRETARSATDTLRAMAGKARRSR